MYERHNLRAIERNKYGYMTHYEHRQVCTLLWTLSYNWQKNILYLPDCILSNSSLKLQHPSFVRQHAQSLTTIVLSSLNIFEKRTRTSIFIYKLFETNLQTNLCLSLRSQSTTNLTDAVRSVSFMFYLNFLRIHFIKKNVDYCLF